MRPKPSKTASGKAKKRAKPATGSHYRQRDDIPVIGWREWLAVPTLGVGPIKAKIDTGARTSTLHAFRVRPFTDGGAHHVAFVIHPSQHSARPAIDCIAPVHDERIVTSSSGHRQMRFVILVEIELGGVRWPIELTLANRDAMGFRMLLGRQALRNRFLVDPDRSFIAGRSHADVATLAL